MKKPFVLALTLSLAGVLWASDMAENPDDKAGWRAMSNGLFGDAREAFAAESADGKTAPREARLGEALSWLQIQPHTDARVRRGVEMLDTLLAEDSRDEVGVKARYFRARAEQVHRLSPSPQAATEHFERLIAEHPAHPLAGQALVKLALVRVYDAALPDAARPRVLKEFGERAARLPDAAARRDLHLVLGEAALRLRLGDAAALEHFLAALEAGLVSRPVRADTLVRVGELAREQGRTELARRHYTLFADEFPRDPRRLLVLERLAALGPGETKS